MSNVTRDDRAKAVICDCLHRRYEYAGDGHIRCVRSGMVLKGRGKGRYARTGFYINGRHYYLLYHQAVWLVCHGRWPKGEIDHIDGDRMNNRIENLRDVSRWQNMRNKLLPWRPNKETQVPGVIIDKRKGLYKTRLFGRPIFSADKYKLFHDAALCGKTYR